MNHVTLQRLRMLATRVDIAFTADPDEHVEFLNAASPAVVLELIGRIWELEAAVSGVKIELDRAVQVAFYSGAKGWALKHYPNHKCHTRATGATRRNFEAVDRAIEAAQATWSVDFVRSRAIEDSLRNIVLAYGMGWYLEDLIESARKLFSESSTKEGES